MSRSVKLNAVNLIIEFATALETCKGIQKLTDDEGYIAIPLDRFHDFCHDIGLILGRTLEKVSKVEE